MENIISQTDEVLNYNGPNLGSVDKAHDTLSLPALLADEYSRGTAKKIDKYYPLGYEDPAKYRWVVGNRMRRHQGEYKGNSNNKVRSRTVIKGVLP